MLCFLGGKFGQNSYPYILTNNDTNSYSYYLVLRLFSRVNIIRYNVMCSTHHKKYKGQPPHQTEEGPYQQHQHPVHNNSGT